MIHISQPSVGEEEWKALKEPLMSGWITQGPKVAEFEKLFTESHQVNHALATTSCTTALHLILKALDIGPDDEVIVPSFTWIATANVVEYCGATPIFVDIDIKTFNINPSNIREKLTKRTKAIIAVHLFGQCADIDAISQAAPGIPIIEDAACAAGALYKGRPAGSLGIAAAFSFHPRKVITTGEGGMVTTQDDVLAEKINALRNHGASISEEKRHLGQQPYILPDFDILGFNYRMTDLQGAIGCVQLKKLPQLVQERKQWAEYYTQQLKETSWLTTPFEPSFCTHSWQSYVCLVEKLPRNNIMEALQSQNISTRPGTHAVHLLGYYREKYNLQPDDFPMSQYADLNSMALPFHNQMKKSDYDYIIGTLKEMKNG